MRSHISSDSPSRSPACETASIVDSKLHVAIIMDGNGRWATSRGRPRTSGHVVGARVVRTIVESAELRDPSSGFTDFVAKGSIQKGAALAAGGDGKTLACATCHGEDLKGLNEVPGITGRTATYIFRQLNDMKTGNRGGALVELMKPVVAKLDHDDMIALAAYLGSRDP